MKLYVKFARVLPKSDRDGECYGTDCFEMRKARSITSSLKKPSCSAPWQLFFLKAVCKLERSRLMTEGEKQREPHLTVIPDLSGLEDVTRVAIFSCRKKKKERFLFIYFFLLLDCNGWKRLRRNRSNVTVLSRDDQNLKLVWMPPNIQDYNLRHYFRVDFLWAEKNKIKWLMF